MNGRFFGAVALGIGAGVIRGHANVDPWLVVLALAAFVTGYVTGRGRATPAVAGAAAGTATALTVDAALVTPIRIALTAAVGVGVALAVAALLRSTMQRRHLMAAVGATAVLAVVPPLVAGPVPVHAQPTAERGSLKVTAAERYLRNEVQQGRLPGLAFGVSERGVPVRTVGIGTRGPGIGSVEPSTQFRIGSMSKSFTALAVTKLAVEGRVELEEDVQAYLPWMPQPAFTVRQLLQHTSGIPTTAGWRSLAGTDDVDAEIERGLRDVERRPPGRAEYSNANYLLAGRVIEAVTGEDYASHLETAVLAPLGLRRTTPRAPSGDNHAIGYRFWFGVPVQSAAPFLDFAVPAGFITSNVPDLLTYLDAVIGRNGTIPAEVRGELLRFDADAPTDGIAAEPFPGHRYGLGWVRGEIAGVDVIWHSGGIADFNSVMVSDPNGEWAFVVLLNTASQVARLMPAITTNVVAALHGQPLEGSVARSLAFTYIAFDLAVVALLALLAATTAATAKRARHGPRDARVMAALTVATAFAVIAIVTFAVPGATGFPADPLSPGDQVALNKVLRTYVPDLGWIVLVLIGAAAAASVAAGAAIIRSGARGPAG